MPSLTVVPVLLNHVFEIFFSSLLKKKIVFMVTVHIPMVEAFSFIHFRLALKGNNVHPVSCVGESLGKVN